jgi:hypothetical protein
MWRVKCDWDSCQWSARFREVDHNVNCCGNAVHFERLQLYARGWQWSRITTLHRLRRVAAALLDCFGEFVHQLCGPLSRLVAGRFWRRPEPKDYEEV